MEKRILGQYHIKLWILKRDGSKFYLPLTSRGLGSFQSVPIQTLFLQISGLCSPVFIVGYQYITYFIENIQIARSPFDRIKTLESEEKFRKYPQQNIKRIARTDAEPMGSR